MSGSTCARALMLALLTSACSQPESTERPDISNRKTPALTAAQCEYFAADGKVRICHATGSIKNPYVLINISDSGCIHGHAKHVRDYVAVGDPTCSGKGCLPQGAPCDATVGCCAGFTCKNGVCEATNRCAGVICTASDQCHVAYCDQSTGTCVSETKIDGFECDDGNACTGTDTCQAGTCTGSNPVTCPASDQCHVAGTCDPASGTCSNPAAADGTACNDGSACTMTDTCQAGVCSGSNPVICTASDQCHVAGTCDPATGTCSNPAAADGTACNDGNACTMTDTCQAGVCTGSDPLSCVPPDLCTVGVCSANAGGCVFSPKNCDDNDPQTIDSCQPSSGQCVHTRVTFCAALVTGSQTFSTSMQGCSGHVVWTTRATLCAPNAHVCTANEWVANRGTTAPAHHYWTDDPLRFGISGCGPSGCGPGNCYVSLAMSGTGACPGNTAPMLVCTGSGANAVDPEGNICNETGCGLDTVSPNEFFGGCAGTGTAGTLCCHSAQFFVDASTGSDTNPGTPLLPFKTIAKALSVAASGEQVNVRPGSYEASTNFETFPLHVPPGVSLIGDEATQGAAAGAPRISGCGTIGSTSAAIAAGAGSVVAGFTVTCASGSGIVATADGLIARNNTVTGTDVGVEVVNGSTNHVISGNAITGNRIGLDYRDSNAGGKVERNTITSNGFGIVYTTAGGDLGGGPSRGGNVLSCNTNADLWTLVSVTAADNGWDHVPPILTNTVATGGVDVYAATPATVLVTGASLAPSPCP